MEGISPVLQTHPGIVGCFSMDTILFPCPELNRQRPAHGHFTPFLCTIDAFPSAFLTFR
jgi:hypothetical protein